MAFTTVVDISLSQSGAQQLPSPALITDFMMYTKSMAFIELFITRLVTSGSISTDQYFSQFLASIVYLIIQDHNIMEKSAAENIVLQLSTFILQFQPPAINVFGVLSEFISENLQTSIIQSLIVELRKNMILDEPIIIEKSQKLPLTVPDALIKPELSYELIDEITFPNGFKNYNLSFKEPDDLNIYIGDQLSNYISLIIKCITNNHSLSIILVKLFVKELKQMENDKYFYNFLICFFYIVSQLMKYQIDITLGDCSCLEYVFDPYFTVFDENNHNFQMFNSLRCESIELLYFAKDASLRTLFEITGTFPLLMIETLARIQLNTDDFVEKLMDDKNTINILLRIAYHYQTDHLLMDDNKEIMEMVRCHFYTLFTFIFTRIEIMKQMFLSPESTEIFISFAREKELEPFILHTISQFALHSQTQNILILSNTVFRFINILSKKLNSMKNKATKHSQILLTNLLNTVKYIAAHQVKYNSSLIPENCKMLCSCLPNLDISPESQNFLKSSLAYIATMSHIFEITELEVESIHSFVVQFKNDGYANFLSNIYICFVQLLAGECFSTISSSFIIQQPQIIKLLIRVYADSPNFHDVLNLFLLLCNFSPINVQICYQCDLDIFIIECLEKAKETGKYDEESMKLLLSLFILLSSYKTDSKTVFRYISLLSPIDDNHISKYHSLFLSTINTIFKDALKEPLKYFPLNGKSIKSQITSFPQIEKGFTFTTWLYINNNNSEYQPNLFSINLTKTFLISVFILGNSAFGVVDDSNKEVKGKLTKNLPLNQWIFFVMTVTFGQGIADFHFFVDCEKAGTFKVQQLEFDTPTLTSSKISLVLGGGQGSKATIVDKMASTGFFPFLNADQIRSIYEIGICRYEQQFPIKPHIFYIKYDSYGIYSMTSFIRTLINHCSINVLLPLLNESNLLLPNDELFNNQFDQTLELFSNLLQFSIDVQKTFCQSSGFEVFSYLIQSKWPHYYNYKTYLQFYQLLENIKYQDLQRQMFINIILNFDILCKIDGDSHYRILRHWEHTLLPTCGSILKDIYNFKQLLSILRLYYWYEPREKGILFKDNRKPFNVDLCRKKIFNILMKYSDDCFNIDDFSLIISHIISCSDEKQIIDLISILISIIDLPNNEIHIQKDNVELMSYLTSLFTIQNQEIHLLTITLIFSLRSKLIISDEYIRRFIHGYMLVLPPNVISGELFNFCFDKREIFKEIYPLCCILAINLGGNYVGKLVNNLHKEFGWVWPMTFSTVADCDQKKQIYKFFAMNFDMVWEDIYLLFDIFFPDSDGEEKSLFLHAIGESILDSSHVSKPTSISSFFMLSKFCILYRKAKKTSSHFGNLFEVYDSDYSKNENLNNQKAFCYQSWNKRILNMEPNPEEYTFGLRFDCSGNWLDKKLAENVIQVYLKHSLPCYLDFILLLISYLYRVGYKDTFQVLSALQIPETWKNEHANYIQMTIYSTFMSNCQQFFKDEMNIDSSAIDTIYDDLIAQSSSEILQKYPRLVNNFKKLAKRREKTIANHLVVDFEKLCSKAIEQISDYRIKHKKKLKKYSTVWHRLYLLLSSDRAPWERKGSKPQFVRDINACFGFVPNKFARQNQVQLNEIFQPKLSNLILDISCDIFFPQTSMPAQFELSEENLNIRFESLRSFSFPLSAITHIFVCDKISIQLYTTIGTTVYMSFPQHNLNIVIEAFEKVTMKGLILFQKLQPFEYFKIQKITDFWSMGKISNYEYLLFLNTVCGRSFNLPDRYPLFPWIFNENGQIRDFSKTVTGTDKYSYSPMNRLIVERFFTNTILNENHVTNQINNQNSEKSIEFSTDGEAIPELYSMSELSSSEQLYAYRKIIESEEVSSEIHKWIKLIWSSGYTPGVEPLFSGDHIPRGKRIHVVDKSMTSHRIIRNKNIISAMIKEGEPKEYYVAIVTDDGILFESIFGDNYQSSKSTIPIINNVTDVVSIESLNQFAFLLKNSSTVSVLSMKPLSVLPVKYERISAISADGSFLVIGSENAIEFVFRNGQLMHYSQLYRDAIISCAVSSSSHIIVSGIKDGTIIISSLVTGTTVHVIDIFPRIPRKIIVSPSWGFITVYCTETTPGSLKKILLIYTVNGKLIRQMEIDFQISFWYAWKSYSCFDYLAMASANGDVYFCENFYIDSIRQVLVGNSPIKAMHYSNETSLLSVVQADGAFVNIPVV